MAQAVGVTRIDRAWRRVWPALLLANLIAAFTLSFRTTDLESVRRWGHLWLVEGRNLYSVLASSCDYPPHAVVLLSPLALLPASLAPWAWAMFNIGCAAIAPSLAARAIDGRAPRADLAILTTTFLCWSATRTLLQFTLLAVLFGLASWRLADRRPYLSGVLLGLALIKPQIALPFVAWTLLARRWTVAAFAAATVASLSALFCVRAQASPVDVIAGYARILDAYYVGPGAMTGVSDLRGAIAAFAPPEAVDLVAGTLAVVLLSVVVWAAMVEWRRGSQTLAVIPGLAASWALLTFRQLSYGFVLLLPASAYLRLGNTRRSPQIGFWVLQALLIVDVPTAFRRASAWGLSAGPLNALFVHFDRLLMVGLFALLIAVHRRALAYRAPARA